MRYIPVTITQDNLVWAINENIRLIEEVLATKVKVDGGTPMLQLDAGSYPVENSVPADDTDACTLARFMELRNV